MKIEASELHTLNDLIRKKRENSNDAFAKENLNQYMEDLRLKYHLKQSDGVELVTGEVQHSDENVTEKLS